MTTHTDHTNRVRAAVDRLDVRIEDLPADKVRELVEATRLTDEERFVMRDRIALAQASGVLSLEEAMTAQGILAPNVFATTAELMAVTQLVVELGR